MCSFWNCRQASLFVPFSLLIFLNVYTDVIIYLKTLLNKNALRGEELLQVCPISPGPPLMHTAYNPARSWGSFQGAEENWTMWQKSPHFRVLPERKKAGQAQWPTRPSWGRSQEIHAFSQSHRIEWATVNVPPSSSLEQPPTTLRGSKISARIWNYQTVTRKNSCYFKHRENKLKSKEDEELRNYGRHNPRGRVNLGSLL